MSRNVSELDIQLIDTAYGQLTSRLYAVLLCYGRLPLPSLQRQAGLSPRQVKHGITVLIQQHLVLWYTDPDNNITLYEANAPIAYRLARSGKYAKAAQDRFGIFTGTLVSYLLLLGHARIGDLARSLGLNPEKKDRTSAASTNGLSDIPLHNRFNGAIQTGKGTNCTLETFDKTVRELLQAGLLLYVHESHFRSDADNRIEAEKQTKSVEEYKMRNKSDREAMWNAEVKLKLDSWKHGMKPAADETESYKGNKRLSKHTGHSSMGKRRRLSIDRDRDEAQTMEDSEEPISDDPEVLNHDHVIRINHAKFTVMLRNTRFVESADHSIGTITSSVFDKVLRALESQLRECQSDVDFEDDSVTPPSISTDKAVALFQDSSSLAGGLGQFQNFHSEDEKLNHSKKHLVKNSDDKKPSIANGEVGWNFDGDDISEADSTEKGSDTEDEPEDESMTDDSRLSVPYQSTVRSHLCLLAEHPSKFLKKLKPTAKTPERWTVDFGHLTRKITEHTVLQTVISRYDSVSSRLVKILLELGKLDDKTLSSLSLITQKEMRNRLVTLQKAGFLELQEVPRDNARVASRTNHLYYFDLERTRAKLLEESYKAMSRCLQRAVVEREKVKSTLEKAARSDVVGREEEFLGEQEREALLLWRGVEQQIWGQVGRLDDMIALLRDF